MSRDTRNHHFFAQHTASPYLVADRSPAADELDRELRSLSPIERELLLDVGQLSLDIIGIFEPTPFADLASGLMSLYRDDLLGAAASGISVIPYIGDLAKLVKLPRYLHVVQRSIHTARASVRFAARLKPIVRKLIAAFDRMPTNRLPIAAREAIERMRHMLDDFLYGGIKDASRIDRLTDDMLRRIFGSTQNVGMWPRKNARKIVEFLNDCKYKSHNLDEWENVLRGIDLHAVTSVEVVTFKRGDVVAQYVDTLKPPGHQTGEWMVKPQGAVSHHNLGLSGSNRQRRLFRLEKDARVLRTKASPAADHWTKGGSKPHSAVAIENGRKVRKPGLQVAGGGDQYFLPNSWSILKEIKVSP